MELLLPYHILLESLPGLLDLLHSLAVVLAHLGDFRESLEAPAEDLQGLCKVLLPHISYVSDVVDLLLELRLFLVVGLARLYLLPRQLEVDLLEHKHFRRKLVPLGLHPLDLPD